MELLVFLKIIVQVGYFGMDFIVFLFNVLMVKIITLQLISVNVHMGKIGMDKLV